MFSQAPPRHIDVIESLLSPAHGSSPLPDTEDPYAQVMRAYETDSTSPFLYRRVARAAMCRQREFPADGIPSTFEISQSSRAVQLHEPDGIRWRDIKCNIRPTVGIGSPALSPMLNSPAAPAAPAPDVPIEAEDEDDDDDVIEQIRARLKMHASVIDLHSDQLDDLALSHFDEYERDVSRLNTRTGNMVRDLTNHTRSGI
ncbi:hypothetical protein Tco_0035670 [Tanacetum coccineum]